MNLHNAIMNINMLPIGNAGFGRTLDYKIGHRDARHAAAELSLKYEAYIEDLEQIASQAIGSNLLSNLKKEHNL